MLRTKPTAPSSRQSAWTPVERQSRVGPLDALASCKRVRRYRIYVLYIYWTVCVYAVYTLHACIYIYIHITFKNKCKYIRIYSLYHNEWTCVLYSYIIMLRISTCLLMHTHRDIYIYSSDSSRIYDMKENASKSNCKDHNLQWTILNMCMVHMPSTDICRRNHAQTCTRTHTVTHVHIRI